LKSSQSRMSTLPTSSWLRSSILTNPVALPWAELTSTIAGKMEKLQAELESIGKVILD
jgi:hypothetical protein